MWLDESRDTGVVLLGHLLGVDRQLLKRIHRNQNVAHKGVDGVGSVSDSQLFEKCIFREICKGSEVVGFTRDVGGLLGIEVFHRLADRGGVRRGTGGLCRLCILGGGLGLGGGINSLGSHRSFVPSAFALALALALAGGRGLGFGRSGRFGLDGRCGRLGGDVVVTKTLESLLWISCGLLDNLWGLFLVCHHALLTVSPTAKQFC
mmetsp:Transcript_17730/g.52569  ORF Transcript_17730/g.52569 Transcript_17730/m.52569 type:complete len:205 (+) Transcript_17730:5054-5668(+)